MGQIPKAVIAAAQQADELHKQTYSAPPDPVPPQDLPQEPPPDPVVLQEPASAEPPKAEVPKKEESADYWKQRFQTIKGKYDAEVPSLVGQIRQLEKTNLDLVDRVHRLEAAPAAPKTVTPSNDPLVSEQEKDEYGAEFTAFLTRIATQAAQRETVKRQPAEPQAPQHAAPPARLPAGQTVQQVLDQRVPRWREINRDPEFIGWLQHPDPFSGGIRHHMLTQAFKDGDAGRVLAFFNAFATSHGATPRPADPAPAPGSAPQAPGKVPLEQLAGPRQNAPTAQSTQIPQERVWTGKEIEKFYRDCTRGLYRGKEAEKAKIENQISAAMMEGRVKPGH
jgi:hypothetical protein